MDLKKKIRVHSLQNIVFAFQFRRRIFFQLIYFSFQGIVSVKNECRPVIVQAVYDLYDLESVETEGETVDNSRFIFIGEREYFFLLEEGYKL